MLTFNLCCTTRSCSLSYAASVSLIDGLLTVIPIPRTYLAISNFEPEHLISAECHLLFNWKHLVPHTLHAMTFMVNTFLHCSHCTTFFCLLIMNLEFVVVCSLHHTTYKILDQEESQTRMCLCSKLDVVMVTQHTAKESQDMHFFTTLFVSVYLSVS